MIDFDSVGLPNARDAISGTSIGDEQLPHAVQLPSRTDGYCIPNHFPNDIIYRKGQRGEMSLCYLGCTQRAFYLTSADTLYQLDTTAPINLSRMDQGIILPKAIADWKGPSPNIGFMKRSEEVEWRLVNAILNEISADNLYQTLHRRFPDFDWPRKPYAFSKDGSHMLIDNEGYLRGARSWVYLYTKSRRVDDNG